MITDYDFVCLQQRKDCAAFLKDLSAHSKIKMETQTGNVISRAYFLFPEDQKM
jgi:hypothetical protein